MFPNKVAPKVPNNIPKNLPFCCFVSFLIVLVIHFYKISESSRTWTIFIMSFISLFELLKLLFQNHLFSFEFLHELLKQRLLFFMELTYFLPKELLLSVMDLLIYLVMNLKVLQTELF